MKSTAVISMLLLLCRAACAQANIGCPSYTDYSAVPHGPYTLGKLQTPSMRPPPGCRTFRSEAVEQAIQDITAAIGDPDWKQLFTNIFPNTLDTTVAWHSGGNGTSKAPYTFLVTGDITAQWIRDSSNQVLPYLPYASDDNGLRLLIEGLVNMQAEELLEYPFGNAFQPPRRSGLEPTENGIAKNTNVQPPYDTDQVFEAKFELDSFASFLQISTAFWRATNTHGFVTSPSWSTAVSRVFQVIRKLQVPTYSATHQLNPSVVRYTRMTDSATETQFARGRGNPAKYTGMVRSLFRPSDDATILPFLVPANAFLSVELDRLSVMLATLDTLPELAEEAQELSQQIRNGVLEYGTIDHPRHGRIFVYETDGYGSSLVMDDANGPSLLSLPYLGFVNTSDPVYQNTRRMVLSADNNPWYFEGPQAAGVGSPHTGFMRVWPMAVAMRGLTSNSRSEVAECLDQLKSTTAGLGLMHESVSVVEPEEYTRSWFAWCNSLTSQFVVDALRRFPGII